MIIKRNKDEKTPILSHTDMYDFMR
jgi:hypothetical protein